MFILFSWYAENLKLEISLVAVNVFEVSYLPLCNAVIAVALPSALRADDDEANSVTLQALVAHQPALFPSFGGILQQNVNKY